MTAVQFRGRPVKGPGRNCDGFAVPPGQFPAQAHRALPARKIFPNVRELMKECSYGQTCR